MEITTLGLPVLTLQKMPEICFSEEMEFIINRK